MIRYSGGKGDCAGNFTVMLNLICVSSKSPGSVHAHTESTPLLVSPGPCYTSQWLDWIPSSCTHSFLFLSFMFLFDSVDSMEMEPTFMPVLNDFALKWTEKCPSIIAANLVPNLCYARQEVPLADFEGNSKKHRNEKGKIYLGGGSS